VAGNTSSNTFSVTPDTAPPAGGSVTYPDGYDADGTVTITADPGADALSGLDSGSGVLERRTTALTGGVCGPFVGGWSAVTSPDTVPDSTCARYRYRVSDRVGNEAIYTLPTSTVKVDLTAPQTTIDVAPGDPSSDASPTFEFSASEGGSTFECRLDGGAWAACTSPRGYAGLADGSHTFQVRATDAAGNVDGTPASHTWVIDTAAPDTSLDSVPPDPSNDDAPSLAFSASESGSTFECRLDAGAWAACTSPETVGLLVDGSHTFQVRATDAAGNVDGSPASYAWTVDTVAPDSSFTVVPADPTNDPTATFEFTASEGGSSFQCRLDGGAWSGCASPATIGPLPDGSHTFDVRATDTAGNQETTPESYTWVVDAGEPSVSIAQPSGFVNASDSDPYTVRATSPDGDVASVELFRCSDASVDCSGGSWVSLGTDATAPYEASWPVDPDGNRALRAVVTDTASNTGSDVVNVTIDRTVPATTIDSAPSDPSAGTSASFAFSASEGGATFECRLDGGAWGACSSPQGYTGLSEGNHAFHVRATDAAGNVDPTPATFGWTVDTVAPETTVNAAPSDPSASPAPSFEFSATEGGSTFECRLDAGAWAPCTSPQAYSGLADGSHTFRVRATDQASNVDATPATYTWTIDATAPGGGLADPGQFLRGTIALSATPTDTGAGVQSVDFQVSPADGGSWASLGIDTSDPYGVDWNTTALADGVYDLRIVVTDNAGNSSPSAVVEDRVVDNTAPGATMVDPGAYLRGTVTLSATATDAGSGVATVGFERSPAGAGSWTPVAASWNTTSVADGLYDLRVRVTDNAGNSTTSALVSNRRVDNTKPSLTSSTPADGTTLASASSLTVVAGEDLAGIANAQIDGAAAPAPTVAGNTVTYTQAFAAGPHVLAGELQDLAGNRQPIRIHFTTWSGSTADYPYVEKNSESTSMSLRSASDTTTVTVPAGAWTGAPAGDWLVLRIDPQPTSGGAGGFQPASEVLDVTAYWALDGSTVTSFALPLQIEIDNTQAHVIPAVFESGAWRPIAQIPGSSLPASWNDGFEYDGSNVRILTRHLSLFTLLEDVQPPTKPGGFKGTVTRGTFSLSWTAAGDNSGLVSAYRIYANGAVVKTVGGSSRSASMGPFKLTDKRAFQVAAVDAAGNVGPKTGSLKVVPKLVKLTLAAAKRALATRGFKAGKITYKASASVPKGRVIAGAASGLRPAGSQIGLTVSKGRPASRPTTLATPTVPPAAPPTTSATTPPPPSATPAPPVSTPTTTVPATTVVDSSEPERARVIPFVGPRIEGLSHLRQELGFGILAAAFSIAVAAGLRARGPATSRAASDPEQILLWDQRLLLAIRRFLRLS
jgi:large repetitive protein